MIKYKLQALLFCSLLFLGFTKKVSAQEVNDLATAKAIAYAEGKLLILDFGASWCGPCKKMEKELWSNDDFKSLYDRFVLVKIDVDYEKSLAQEYQANALPTVVVATPNEDILCKKTGYQGASEYLKLFTAFPKDNSKLNNKLSKANADKTVASLLGVAKELGLAAMNTEDRVVKRAFIAQSDDYLGKCKSKKNSEDVANEILFFKAKNKMIKGSHKKNLKTLKKLKKKKTFEAKPDYYNFLYAFCYKMNGDEKGFDEYYSSISSDTLKEELNEIP